MDKKALISILSSVYNERAYIEEAIDSVLKQTYEHWEWIIVDDGSTDGTGDILKGIRDKRVKRVFQGRTGSLAGNMNRALAISNGDIIAVLDGDDYWPENKIELQMESFDDRGVVLSYGECAVINAKGRSIGHVCLLEDSQVARNEPKGSALRSLLVNVDCFICNATAMYRKSSLLDIGGFVEKDGLPPDFSTWVKLSLTGKFSPIPSCLGYYRKHCKSMSFTRDHVSTFEKQIAFLREFFLQNFQAIRDCGVEIELDALESGWRRIKVKTQIIQKLMRFSSFVGIDLVNPLILFLNRHTHIKKMAKRIIHP